MQRGSIGERQNPLAVAGASFGAGTLPAGPSWQTGLTRVVPRNWAVVAGARQMAKRCKNQIWANLPIVEKAVLELVALHCALP